MNSSAGKLLSQTRIEDYARAYKHDEVLFSQEEKDCKSQLYKIQSEIKRLEKDIKSLGIKRNPGASPDYDPFVKPLCKTIGWIWGISLLLVFLFHCLIWIVKLLFDIPWDTWGWTKSCFFYGLYAEIICFAGGSIIYGIVYWIWQSRKNTFDEWKQNKNLLTSELNEAKNNQQKLNKSLSNIETNRQNILTYAYKLRLGLPIRVIPLQDIQKAHNKLFELLDQKDCIDAMSDDSERYEAILAFYNRKLKLFHQVSVPSEATSIEIFNSFNNSVKAIASPREILKPAEAEKNNINSLVQKNSAFSSESLDSQIDEFNDLLEMDTSGFLTKHDSALLDKQVMSLDKVYKSALSKYKEHERITQSINHTLGVVRLLAYRNIYLGAELLNVVREGAGGGKLTTAYDSIESSMELEESNIPIASFSSSKAISDMFTNGIDSISKSVNNILSDKKARKYAVNNPKAAALTVAGTAAFAVIESGIQAWKKRNAKIDSLLKYEDDLIKNMEQVVDSYLVNLSSAERALELIKAIIKANQGFLAIYTPLSDKVFIDKTPSAISMVELQKLTQAIGAYKQISDSKLK